MSPKVGQQRSRFQSAKSYASAKTRMKTVACPATSNECANQDDFDSVAWMAIVDHQRMLIARAAGVDPSKVKIHVGH